MNRILYIIIFSLFFIQCEEDKHIPVSNKNVPGRYIHLDIENIYLFVPEDIKIFTIDEYAQQINNIKNKELKKIERARYLQLKYGSEGNFYIMGDNDYETSIMFHAMPYMEINQSLSQLILRGINQKHKAFGNVIGYESTFKKAGIIKKGKGRIFRAIFLYKNLGTTIYTYFYVVTRKGKTFVLSFNSRKAYDFDSYVQKIRL